MKTVTLFASFIKTKQVKIISVPDETTEEEIHNIRKQLIEKFIELGFDNIVEVVADFNGKSYSD